MKVAYMRVSSLNQNLYRQEDLMKQLGVEKVFEEKISGKDSNRPQLKAMLNFLREGDELIVESISRLARNTRDLLEITELLDEKCVKFVSKKESIDTSTPTGKFMLTVFGAIAELERNYILERQAEGIAAGKKRGVKFGRPNVKLSENMISIFERNIDGKISAVEAMKILGLKKTTYYKLMKQYKENAYE